MTKLSVGIPAYNQGNYLLQTLRSLMNQEELPYEIVVSDNHSTDQTPRILKKFGNTVRIVRPPRHLPMMAHWNFLVSNLKGNWFALMSSDDVAKPNFVKTLIAGTTRSDRAVLVRSGWENIDGDGKLINNHYLLSTRKKMTPPQTFLEQLSGPKHNFAAFAAKTSAWDNVGGFPEQCKLIGDWAFWLKLSAEGDFVYEHQLISQYRTNYRLGITQARLQTELEDELFICTKIIPEVAEILSLKNSRKIKVAARRRFIGRLAAISQNKEALLNDSLINTLEKLAKDLQCQREYHQFRQGKIFRLPGNTFRKYLRPFVQYLRTQ
ncbi:MAG: glycosyltransferase family 2 protein [Syntrophaceae bacterium]|nr:glycosyltransferase family 2 protein [Syntrophaceae bacterium]